MKYVRAFMLPVFIYLFIYLCFIQADSELKRLKAVSAIVFFIFNSHDEAMRN